MKPESVAPEKRLNVFDKEPKSDIRITPPYSENPYNLYRPSNRNNARCLTPASWQYWVGSHPLEGESNDTGV